MLDVNMFGSDAIFDHVGLVVKSIKDAVNDDSLEIFKDEVQKVSVAFIKVNGIELELIEPSGEDSPINLNLQKEQRLVHLCYRVPKLEEAVKKGRENGFHCISKPKPAVAYDNKNIVWLFNRIYGLVELVES